MNSIDDRLTELESALDDQQARIEAHEETIAAQQETIEAQRERLAAVENGGGSTLPMSRRGALAAGGALGLLGLGAGTASAQGSGQIGTSDTPVDTVYTEKLNGGLTNGSEIQELVGFGLEIYESSGRLDVDWDNANGLNSQGIPERVRNFDGIELTTGNEFNPVGNIIAGYIANTVGEETIGAVISGGGASDGGENSIGTDSNYSTIGGGLFNLIDDDNSNATIGGGSQNTVSGFRGTVAGGGSNEAAGSNATIGGGQQNEASGSHATVAGGGGGGDSGNHAVGDYSSIAGGSDNHAEGEYSSITGGAGNLAKGRLSSIPGGSNNRADGDYSFAVGQAAEVKEDHDGAFIVGDSSGNSIESTREDQARFQMNVGANAFELLKKPYENDGDADSDLESGDAVIYLKQNDSDVELVCTFKHGDENVETETIATFEDD